MKNILLLLFVSVLTFTFTSVKAQGPYLTPFTDMTYQQLVEEVLLNDTPCAEISNVVGTTGVDFGNATGQGIGRFENSNPLFPMESGVVLATGGIMDAGTIKGVAGPTGNFSNTFPGGGWPNDPQLTAYLNANQNVPAGGTYHDASILEFDFTSFTDSISFNFVFASNEYGTFQCSYSDSFAFFLEAPDGTVTNLAVLKDPAGNIIPGAGGDEIPISVVTIRDNAYNGGCVSENPSLFDTYWDNNNANAPINILGQTVMMQAWTYVTPYTTYKMKMVIQDRTDSSYDSAVFLEAGSFFIGNIDLGGDIDLTDENAVCIGEAVVLEVDLLPDCDYQWFYEGVLIPGEESNIITVTQPGYYSLEVSCGDQLACVLEDEIYVAFKVTPELPQMWNKDINICGSFTNFELVATPTNLNQLTIVDYAWYFNGVRDDSNTGSTYNVTQPGQYTVVVDELGCAQIGTINVYNTDFIVDLGPDVLACDEGSTYTLTADVIPQGSTTLNPADIEYLWITGETTESIDVSSGGLYWVEVTYDGCTEIDQVMVEIADSPMVTLGSDVQKCKNEILVLEAIVTNMDASQLDFIWYDGSSNQIGTGSTLEITEIFGGEEDYTVRVFDPLTPACYGEDTINVSYFSNENCTITQGLSPDGSPGHNDNLDLKFLSDRTGIANLQIFNRFGVIVYEYSNYIDQWEGQSKAGELLPTGLYYYVINFSGNDPVFGNQANGYIYLNRAAN